MRRFGRFALPLVILAVLAAVWAGGLLPQLDWATLRRHHAALAAWVAEHPVGAPLACSAIYAAITALCFPETAIFTVAAGLLLGTLLGGVTVVIGATAGAVALFVIARTAFAHHVAARAGPRLVRLRAHLHRDGFHYLLAIRLIPLFPFWLVNLSAALSGMRLRSYAAATFLGIIPGTFVFTWIGGDLGDVLAAGQRPELGLILSPGILGPLLALALLALAPVAWRRWRG